jgi:hypothetical protein
MITLAHLKKLNRRTAEFKSLQDFHINIFQIPTKNQRVKTITE